MCVCALVRVRFCVCVCVFVCAHISLRYTLCIQSVSACVRASVRAGVHAARSRRDQNASVHNFAKIMCDRSAVVVVDRLSASIRDERGGQRVSTIIDFMCMRARCLLRHAFARVCVCCACVFEHRCIYVFFGVSFCSNFVFKVHYARGQGTCGRADAPFGCAINSLNVTRPDSGPGMGAVLVGPCI